ncbi:MAG: MarR family winged helix-turn-helix transcriptional regulator [Leifsonia flava]
MARQRDEHAASVLRALIRISRRGVADARTAGIRLSLTDQSIVAFIVDNPGSRSTDIAREFLLNRSTVSRQLTNLVKLGVVREATDAGGRGRPLELTETGWEAYRESLGILQNVVDAQLADWTDGEVAAFAESLARFNAARPADARPSDAGPADAASAPQTPQENPEK